MSTNDYLKFDGRFTEPPYDDDKDKRIAELEAEIERLTSCICISKTEPYQLLETENKRLTALADERGKRMELMLEDMPAVTWYWIRDKHHGHDWFDEDGSVK